MVTKRYHEIRDPIHGFVRLDSDERRVLDSPPVQRLRNVHQLAMSYLVYPGATHKRFEHSLGVMELAGRVFDVVTTQDVHESVVNVVRNVSGGMDYWRRVVRMAALCHDIGHPPFSHAAERALLPAGRSHESMTVDLILSDSMTGVWNSMRPILNPMDIAKISVGQDKLREEEFTDWETLLSEIISSDALGVDRIDYLLRDSHHAGVAYGRFDHYRLIDTMRILPAGQNSDEPTLGIEFGGIHSTEALLLARYFMFMQVYEHPVRVAYDIHLAEFLGEWLPGGQFPLDKEAFLKLNDNNVLEAIAESARDSSCPGHEHAARIIERNHFKRVYSPTLADKNEHENPVEAVAKACAERYGEADVRKREARAPDEEQQQFPVLDPYGRVESSHTLSAPLSNIPAVDAEYVLINPEYAEDASSWIRSEKDSILARTAEGNDNGAD